MSDVPIGQAWEPWRRAYGRWPVHGAGAGLIGAWSGASDPSCSRRCRWRHLAAPERRLPGGAPRSAERRRWVFAPGCLRTVSSRCSTASSRGSHRSPSGPRRTWGVLWVGVECLGMTYLAQAMGIGLSLAQGCLIMALLVVGIMVPADQGIRTFHAPIIFGLTSLFGSAMRRLMRGAAPPTGCHGRGRLAFCLDLAAARRRTAVG